MSRIRYIRGHDGDGNLAVVDHDESGRKMKIEVTLGNPVEPGIYAARQWYGWRILEWHSGQWWYPGKVAQWPHKAEIEAHIGPLPVIAQDFSVPEKPEVEEWETLYNPSAQKTTMEFDL